MQGACGTPATAVAPAVRRRLQRQGLTQHPRCGDSASRGAPAVTMTPAAVPERRQQHEQGCPGRGGDPSASEAAAAAQPSNGLKRQPTSRGGQSRPLERPSPSTTEPAERRRGE